MRFFVLLAVFPAAFLPAQSGFLKNPDIVWAAEIEQDWVVDIPSLEDERDQGITTLKLLRTDRNEIRWTSPYLADLVFQAALEGKFPVFKDAQCRIPADIFQVYPSRDTVVTFDSETYAETVRVVYVEPVPFWDFQAWRLRQILAYHVKSATWSTTTEAIAPLVLIKNNHGDSIGIRPLFWFRPDSKRQNLTSSHIIWAKKTENRQAKTQVSTNPGRLIKVTDGFRNPLEHLFRILGTDMKTPFYNDWNEKPLSPEDRASMLAPTDTVVTFDPDTYEEKRMVVRNEVNAGNIGQLRLLQTWYWDERRSRLSICLDAVAPLVDVLDANANFRYQRPLFYRRAKR